MDSREASRRLFLIRSFSGLSAGWVAARMPGILAAQEHAHRAAQSKTAVKFEFLSAEQAADVEAIAAQIIPTDDTPGAREAGVIYFLDRALTTFDRDKQGVYTQGLADVNARARGLAPEVNGFAGLTAAQQIQLLRSIENTEFFELVRIHTVAGFFGNPERGGNRDKAGWKLIGFKDQFAFEPPFGFYDRDYSERHDEI